MDVVVSQLQAKPDEVNCYVQRIENSYTPEELKQVVTNWHAIVTADPQPIDPGPELRLPLPENLAGIIDKTSLDAEQLAALQAITSLPLDARPDEIIPVIDCALATLALHSTTVKANVQKFDVYDSYFNVTRTNEKSGITFLAGLLQAFRNVMEDLQTPPHTLTVVELPMLRIALETALSQFGV
jgi:hypothetical protein